MAGHEAALIIFLRSPEKGKVKTRLAATLGEPAALEIYKELIALTMQVAKSAHLPVYVFYEGKSHLLEKNKMFQYHKQCSGDLGERMFHALSTVLHDYSKAIIIGSDCPELAKNDIRDAIVLLDAFDYVLGPAADGGFYLMGCKSIDSEIFTQIPWGTETVLEKTLQAATRLEKRCTLLRTLLDIDTEEDWKKYKDLRN